jgi:hypothetical protein
MIENALAEIGIACDRLLDAHCAAASAKRKLTGARATRAAELVDMIAQAIAHGEQLEAAGDLRAQVIDCRRIGGER